MSHIPVTLDGELVGAARLTTDGYALIEFDKSKAGLKVAEMVSSAHNLGFSIVDNIYSHVDVNVVRELDTMTKMVHNDPMPNLRS